MRTKQEILDDIARWTGDVHNKYIVRRLKAELEEVEKGVTVVLPDEPEPEEDYAVTGKYTRQALFAMNKKAQIEILEELGVDEIPRYEKGRISLILEKQ